MTNFKNLLNNINMKLPVKYDALKPYEKRAVRLAYAEEQKGYCYHCFGPLDKEPLTLDKKVKPYLYPPGFFDHPLHLHHNHNTGLTLGTVHAHCNAVLWEYYGE